MPIGKRPTWLPLTLAFVAVSFVFAEGAAAKCFPQGTWPGLERGEPVVLVDGSFAGTGLQEGSEALEELDPSDIHSIDIICWNPETGEFQPGGGLNVISIVTTRLAESKRAPITAKAGRALREMYEVWLRAEAAEPL